MIFVCQIGNCKRNKYPTEFTTWEGLHRHINGATWLHGRALATENMALRKRREDVIKMTQRAPVPGKRGSAND